ncbi:unnamed protein product, partial [Ectocarpus sp. 8 AP-2014]
MFCLHPPPGRVSLDSCASNGLCMHDHRGRAMSLPLTRIHQRACETSGTRETYAFLSLDLYKSDGTSLCLKPNASGFVCSPPCRPMQPSPLSPVEHMQTRALLGQPVHRSKRDDFFSIAGSSQSWATPPPTFQEPHPRYGHHLRLPRRWH